MQLSPVRSRPPGWKPLAHAVSPVILFGKGVTAQRDEQLVEALISLAKLIGAVDSERVGLLSVKGEANSVAAALLGLDEPFDLNGEQAIYVALGDDFASTRSWRRSARRCSFPVSRERSMASVRSLFSGGGRLGGYGMWN